MSSAKNRRILTMTGGLCILTATFLSQIVGLFVSDLPYYGFLLSVTYGLIIVLKVLVVTGYNKYSENLRAQKYIFIAVGILLMFLGLFSTYIYLYMYSHDISGKFPIWIICVQLAYSVSMFLYSAIKFFTDKKAKSPLDKLFRIVSAVARVLTITIAVNAILGLTAAAESKWYLCEQGALFTASIFGFGIYTLVKSRSIEKSVAT